jgi:hypothetical protein
LYYESLKGINANTIILVGVAHRVLETLRFKTKSFLEILPIGIAYGDLKVSALNAEIMSDFLNLPLVHNDMQELEHSLEAIILLHRKK